MYWKSLLPRCSRQPRCLFRTLWGWPQPRATLSTVLLAHLHYKHYLKKYAGWSKHSVTSLTDLLLWHTLAQCAIFWHLWHLPFLAGQRSSIACCAFPHLPHFTWLSARLLSLGLCCPLIDFLFEVATALTEPTDSPCMLTCMATFSDCRTVWNVCANVSCY